MDSFYVFCIDCHYEGPISGSREGAASAWASQWAEANKTKPARRDGR